MTASSQTARDGRAVRGRRVSASAPPLTLHRSSRDRARGAFVHRFTAGPWVMAERALSRCCLVCPCDPVDCSPPGSSVHAILQAGTLEWVAISSSRGSSQPRDRTLISCTPTEPRGKPQHNVINYTKFSKCWVLFLTPLNFSVIEFINKEEVVCSQSSK